MKRGGKTVNCDIRYHDRDSMTRDNWKLNKDFDELTRDMYDFSINRFNMLADVGGFLTPVKQKAEQINKDRPQAQ